MDIKNLVILKSEELIVLLNKLSTVVVYPDKYTYDERTALSEEARYIVTTLQTRNVIVDQKK